MHMGRDTIWRDEGVETFSHQDIDIGIPIGGLDGDREKSESVEQDPEGRKEVHNERK